MPRRKGSPISEEDDYDYDELRERYRPGRVVLLLIGESAPDPAGAARRFFYAPTLTRHDNLFRGVIGALYGHRPAVALNPAKRTRLSGCSATASS
jgi:hypothetical protein